MRMTWPAGPRSQIWASSGPRGPVPLVTANALGLTPRSGRELPPAGDM